MFRGSSLAVAALLMLPASGLTITTSAAGECGGTPNDCFANPIALDTEVSLWTSTVGASLEAGEPRPCGSIGSTVWYTFTAAYNGTGVVDTIGSSYDTVVAV